MKNYSRQREAILKVVSQTKCHPTASWVYEQVKKEIPNISLGTVYRNLAELTASGDISCLNLSSESVRFDGDTKPHVHLCCNKCGSITDIETDVAYFENLAKQNGFTPESEAYLIYGICKDCAKE